MDDRDPIEDGQAECRFCGEWYRVTLPSFGHDCAAKREHDEAVKFTRPEALRGGRRVAPGFLDDDEIEF
jgi:hypothetical protein